MGALAVAALALTACSTESLRRVSASDSPLFDDASGAHVRGVVHAGDLVEVVREGAGTARFSGDVDGHPLTREGALVEVRRASGEPAGFVFAGDLGDTRSVPKAAALCRRLEQGEACIGRLRRTEVGTALYAWDPCLAGSCRVGALDGEKLVTIEVDGLADLQAAVVGGVPVALATGHWSQGVGFNGTQLAVLAADAHTLRRAASIRLDELDARHAPAAERKGRVRIEGDRLVFEGERRVLRPGDNGVLYRADVKEVYQLAK